MNRTTVKRGIGAVILALVAAALLAILLKDKAAQRQDVVDMALPGADGGIQTSSSTRLPELSTDNSGNGTVIDQAGQTVTDTTNTAVDSAKQTGAATLEDAADATGKVIASAAAVGATAVGSAKAAGDASADAAKTIDFNVRDNQTTTDGSKATSGLDLVNNGTETAATANTTQATTAAATQPAEAPAAKSKDQGVVIASSTPKTAAKSSGSQARLIGEKKATPPKSSRTARVITKPAKKSNTAVVDKASESAAIEKTTAVKPDQQAKNGYAIQLLATSSVTRANDLKKVMAGEGYPTYTTKVTQNGKLLYRVRIGQYKTRSAAATVQNAMKRRYKKNANVNRSAIVAR